MPDFFHHTNRGHQRRDKSGRGTTPGGQRGYSGFSSEQSRANTGKVRNILRTSSARPQTSPGMLQRLAAPGAITVTPCSKLPRQIFSRGGCGGGTDFTHNDFQSLSGVGAAGRALVWQADNLSTDFRLRNDMRLELGILAGSEGWRMVDHFAGGSGTTLSHDNASTLGSAALASAAFTRLNSATLTAIEAALAAMASAGTIDCNALSLAGTTLPGVSFSFSDGFALKGIIGGTQGLRIRLTELTVDPVSRSYDIGLQYLICDDFGVDTADLYSPALAAFWVLQHRRSGNLPFINELDLTRSASGSF
ncbi:hypothetical protein SG34_019915 [Thalassomonas viridans]|uniref:Uncharacterized protein n=1 Tax=Thalassomonas viridans TaxID=137584 RepID=A0AAE9YZ62_9GAMM|nr:hypothetical protein [Thalassomonas viridans]WDE03633.1 hypothetical protein SG34_019915 [Thalassomonas viridans]